MVEQRGVEPLTSALRTRRSAKLSYCPTRSAILGSAVEECQGVGECVTDFRNVLATALGDLGFATAAAVEHRARFAHQCIHVAHGISGTRKHQASSVFVTRSEEHTSELQSRLHL